MQIFKDRIDCPFNDIGCKFSHDDQVEDESIDDVNPKYDYYCTFCYSKFETQNDLIVHMRDVHTHRPISTYPATEWLHHLLAQDKKDPPMVSHISIVAGLVFMSLSSFATLWLFHKGDTLINIYLLTYLIEMHKIRKKMFRLETLSDESSCHLR